MRARMHLDGTRQMIDLLKLAKQEMRLTQPPATNGGPAIHGSLLKPEL